ncbi:MAG: molecular chaperone TorD family protein [Anaerolineales bacterium]|nr:molecular chaperone TorD family protein [Anaerolineales bacterium]
MSVEMLAEIYAGLAEALARPPAGWLSAPGRGWPLYAPVVQLAAQSQDERWKQAVLQMAAVGAGSAESRQRELRESITPGALYECQHVNGRFPGPATFAVKNLYARTGLVVEGAEMPDHATAELAFLAYLCEQEARGDADGDDWRAAQRLFIRNHAGKWLPEVGRALLRSASPAWAALGQVLVASLDVKRLRKSLQTSEVFPYIAEAARCNLCGFCVQVCLTQALRMREDEQHTELWLLPKKCVGCHKCEQACDPGALTLTGEVQAEPRALRRSERAHCPHCGALTVSQAELEAVAARLGEHPAWLDTCLPCR